MVPPISSQIENPSTVKGHKAPTHQGQGRTDQGPVCVCPLTQSPRDTANTPGAGWSSPVARQAHNLKVAGSNPAPATNPITTLHPPRRSYLTPQNRAHHRRPHHRHTTTGAPTTGAPTTGGPRRGPGPGLDDKHSPEPAAQDYPRPPKSAPCANPYNPALIIQSWNNRTGRDCNALLDHIVR